MATVVLLDQYACAVSYMSFVTNFNEFNQVIIIINYNEKNIEKTDEIEK